MELLNLSLVAQSIAGDGGWAGWAGFLSSGGVLVWLLFRHLPEKDRQEAERRMAHAAQVDGLVGKIETLVRYHTEVERSQRDVHSALEREQRAEFRSTLDAMLKHNRDLVDGLANALKEDLGSLRDAVDNLSGVMNKR